LDIPVEVDDEYWENENNALAFQQPPRKPPLVASFNTFIKLSQIIAFALTTLVPTVTFSCSDSTDFHVLHIVCCRQIKIKGWRFSRAKVARRGGDAFEYCNDGVG
jgi:hypothetical protein